MTALSVAAVASSNPTLLRPETASIRPPKGAAKWPQWRGRLLNLPWTLLKASIASLMIDTCIIREASAQPLTEAGDRGSGPPSADQPGEAETSDQPAQQERGASIASSLPTIAAFDRTRSLLEKAGIAYLATYIGEGLANPRGGMKRGGVVQGRIDLQVDADLKKLAGIPGLILHGNIYHVHGSGLTGCCLGNLFVASGLETVRHFRLYELWVEQKMLRDKISIRAGQLAADTEFFVSQYGGLFINSTFGWPHVAQANLPNGGPSYPTATPGARIKIIPHPQMSLSIGVFNGDPVGSTGLDHPHRRDRSGLAFRFKDPAVVIGEVAFAYFQSRASWGLPGIVKFGAWYHFGRFDHIRYGRDGLSLADPASVGTARSLKGNFGVYGLIDQFLYRAKGTEDGGIGLFARMAAAPSDRNIVSFYADGGLTFKGFIPGRPNDTFGIGVAHTNISRHARSLDHDRMAFGYIAGLDPQTGRYTGDFMPVRSHETLIEATYQGQIVPGVTLQPDVQFILRPGGKIPNPMGARNSVIPHAVVFGIRMTIRY